MDTSLIQEAIVRSDGLRVALRQIEETEQGSARAVNSAGSPGTVFQSWKCSCIIIDSEVGVLRCEKWDLDI